MAVSSISSSKTERGGCGDPPRRSTGGPAFAGGFGVASKPPVPPADAPPRAAVPQGQRPPGRAADGRARGASPRATKARTARGPSAGLRAGAGGPASSSTTPWQAQKAARGGEKYFALFGVGRGDLGQWGGARRSAPSFNGETANIQYPTPNAQDPRERKKRTENGEYPISNAQFPMPKGTENRKGGWTWR